MKIKVKDITGWCFPVRKLGEYSDCFDLFLAEPVSLQEGSIGYFKLGIAVKLPKGMIAKIYSRSSSPMKYKIEVPNGLGFIDNAYQGNDDEWRICIHATEDIFIPTATSICQFEVQLSQFATIWQKLRWLFSNGVTLERVDRLSDKNRGGIGSTDK